MNKKISTSLSITLVALLAIVVGAYTLIKSRNVNSADNNQTAAIESPSKKSDTCRVHAFQGSTDVTAWQTTKNGKTVLQIAKKDTYKLPVTTAEDFKLIDPTPEISQKIATSSEQNPIELSISGFATLCDGTNLACTSYKDGIFHSYVN